MKVYILNTPNTYNYGSMMMAENFIYYFNKLSGRKNEYYVETDDTENTQRRIKEAIDISIYAVPVGTLYSGYKISKVAMIFGILSSKGILSELVKKLDMIVVLGGDDFTEDHGWRSLISRLLKINVLTGVTKVYFLGQTMGPFYSFRINLVKYFLSNAKSIYCRDNITYDYLKSLKLNNVSKIADLALLPLAKERKNSFESNQIVFFPSQLIYNFAIDKSIIRCTSFFSEIIRCISNKFPQYKITMIPHVLKPAISDDRIMLSNIYKNVKNELGNKINIIEGELFPYQVRNHIKKSKFIVTARIHPFISALECEVPGICFSYSRKYWGMIGEEYDLKDFILDVRYENYPDLLNRFEEVVDNIGSNYEEIVKRLKEKNVKSRKLIIAKLREIIN